MNFKSFKSCAALVVLLITALSCSQDDGLSSEEALIKASFTSDKEQVLVGGEVSFTDNSEGTPDAWNWIFAGGTPSTSTEQNPVIEYSEKGSYSVTLIVEKGAEKDTLIIENYISVCEDTFTKTEGGEERNGVYGYDDQGRIVLLDFTAIRAEISYDEAGHMTGIDFFEGDNISKERTFFYDNDGQVIRVEIDQPDRFRKYELSYEEGAGGETIVTSHEFEKSASGEFEATGSFIEYTVINGNVTAFTEYRTDDQQNVVEEERGTVTYGTDEWRVDMAILFDQDEPPVLFNKMIPTSISVSYDGGSSVDFSGTFEVSKSGDEITSVEHTFSQSGIEETILLTFDQSCE